MVRIDKLKNRASLWESLNVEVKVERVDHHTFYQLTGDDNMDNLLRDEKDGASSWSEGAPRQLIGARVQICSPLHARRNTKIVYLGTIGQIDTPYLTSNTCGMAAVVEGFRGWPNAGHVTLKSVERSRLALAAEELL